MAKLIEDMSPAELQQYAQMLRGESSSNVFSAPKPPVAEVVETLPVEPYKPRPLPTRTAAESAEVFNNAPRNAADSAGILENVDDAGVDRKLKQESYEKLFGKQAVQDTVDAKSVPGKSAADAAEVLEGADESGIDRKARQEALDKALSKQAAQDLVDAKAIPGKSAADSAKVFGAPDTEAMVKAQSIPGKSAADSAKVFESAGHDIGVGKSARQSAEVFEAAGDATKILPEATEVAQDTTKILPQNPFQKLAAKFPSKEAFADFLGKMKGAAPVLRGAAKVAGPVGTAIDILTPEHAGAAADYPVEGAMMMGQTEGPGFQYPKMAQPNGGLTGEALDKHIAANPGPAPYDGANMDEWMPKAGFTPGGVGPSDGGLASLVGRADAKLKEHAPAMAAPQSVPGGAPKLASRAPATKAPPTPEAGPQFQTQPTGEDSPQARLKAAQERADMLTLINQLGKAGTMIGSGISGVSGGVKPTEVDTKIFDTNIALAQQLPGRVAEELKMERQDPKSPISASSRDFIKKSMGVNVPDNVSADQLKEQFPIIEKFLQAQEANKTRRESARQHNETMAANKATQADAKAEREANRDFVRMNEKIEGGIASSRSVLGKSDATIRAARAIKALATQYGNPDELDSRQIAEIARGLDGMLSQGQATVEGTKKLIPKTFKGGVATVQEYASSLPKGAQQGEFVKRMLHTIDREIEVAEEMKGEIKDRLIGGYSHLKAYDPDRWNDIMKKHRLEGHSESASTGHSPGPSAAPTTTSAYKPGSIIKVKGKQYKVASDGDSLEEIQ